MRNLKLIIINIIILIIIITIFDVLYVFFNKSTDKNIYCKSDIYHHELCPNNEYIREMHELDGGKKIQVIIGNLQYCLR